MLMGKGKNLKMTKRLQNFLEFISIKEKKDNANILYY